MGDTFRIANGFVTLYGTTIYSGAPPLVFNGSGQSALAIDAFLGAPGSTADNLIIDGDVSGQTKVKVNNTNTGPGVFNKEGIPVVFVNGATPKGNEFFLGNPIDTGFFNYDLFFRPTGSGVFELRSFLGQGAFVLPQLITASQDIWHQTQTPGSIAPPTSESCSTVALRRPPTIRMQDMPKARRHKAATSRLPCGSGAQAIG